MIELQRKKIPAFDAKVLRHTATSPGHFSHIIDKSTKLVDEKTGETKIVYLDVAEPRFLGELSTLLQKIRYDKNDRTGGMPTVSRIFGYAPRITIRKDFCSGASLNSEDPIAYRKIVDAATLASILYEEHNPALYERHNLLSQKVLPDYRLGDTAFTSGIINKNNQLRYHFDSGNFKDVWSAMFVFKKDVDGGFLSVPEYDVGFKLSNFSLLLFDGQSILHGVTPIRLMSPKAFRLSIVFYSLRLLWNCVSPADELLRIRKVKTGREIKRAR